MTHKPLLHKLLTLGQRKSLAQWQRVALDQCINELLQEMQHYALVDQILLDDMARYDAFRLGITLEDEEIAPPAEQLMDIFKRQQEADEAAAKNMRDTRAARKQAAQEDAEQRVEHMLDRQLGPEPEPPENRLIKTEDLWQDELNQELEQQRAKYREARAALRKELLDELLEAIDQQFESDEMDSDEDEETFDFNFDEEGAYSDPEPIPPNAPKITNQIFQRLFRSTAAKLHPDREPDAAIRQVKQSLIGDLLKARKKGDVMTLLALHQEYVGGHETRSKADEKQLVVALEHQVNELKTEKEHIAQQSPLHQMAYQRFYSPSKNKVDKAIAKHLAQVSQDKIDIELMAKDIRSLKTLKPWLEQRYDEG